MAFDKKVRRVCQTVAGIAVGAFGMVFGFLLSPYLAASAAGPIRPFSVSLGSVIGWTVFCGSTVAGLVGGTLLGIRVGGGVSEAILLIANHFRGDHEAKH